MEVQLHCGLKQGDPLAPYLFILVMESLHLSVSRAIEAGFFSGIKIDPNLSISHLFYVDDAVFIGEWSEGNLQGIMQMLHCFSLVSDLKINLHKSQLLGVGVASDRIIDAAGSIGCSIMKAPFKYLGVMVGGNMSKINAWDETVAKVKSRLSKRKLNTLSIGGRFTLLKRLLALPRFIPCLYKGFRSLLMLSWNLFVAIFSMVPKESSCGYRCISAMFGNSMQPRFPFHFSNWMTIIPKVYALKNQGVDFLSHCKLRVGSSMRTLFWKDIWLGDTSFCMLFPWLYALDNSKDCTGLLLKLQGVLAHSFRRPVRGGVEADQLDNIMEMVQSKVFLILMIDGFGI
ncbi:RNA-directed DNA polymerase, eukaryota [Tanacetum coccineum]|uniref:RNA-directed DNA polymerase, eukaryota n=1 Tax=Tanacetum coccineum TaxID=301880 RepID=A0ABQ5DK46_9ASTR